MQRRRGFTLVELLVVIGIIAVLIGLLLPALGRARAQANMVACSAGMRDISNAFVQFQMDHKGWLPKAYFNGRPTGKDVAEINQFGSPDDWGLREPEWGWDYAVFKYLKNSKKVFRCPADTSDTTRGVQDAMFPSSYRVNASNQPDGLNAIKLVWLKQSSTAIWLAEGKSGSGIHHLATWETPGTYQEGQVGEFYGAHVDYKRHPKKLNYVFADGHCESLAWADTWKPIGPAPAELGSRSTSRMTMWRRLWLHSVAEPNNAIKVDVLFPPPLKPAD